MNRCLLLACLAANLGAQTTLDVHVYDWAQVPPAVIRQARDRLAGIFHAAGIELRWIPKPLELPEARMVTLVEPPRTGRERDMACRARRDIALSILKRSVATVEGARLGSAEPLAPTGINATVFYDAVFATAAQQDIPEGVLLAHAIAHEIGHVLLRTTSHRRGLGLMSGGWGDEHYQMIRSTGLYFKKADARSMVAELGGEGCRQILTPVSATSPTLFHRWSFFGQVHFGGCYRRLAGKQHRLPCVWRPELGMSNA